MPRLPEVSVVIPARNAEATILRAIDSVGPGGGACEVLVVNDGSTDDSAALLDDAALRRPWLRVLHTPHRGIVSALNMGIAHARAALIARLDADDEALPGRIDLQRTFLHDNPEIGLVGGLVEFAGDAYNARGYALHVEWTNSVRSEEELFLLRFVESPFPHPSVMFRRCLIERLGATSKAICPRITSCGCVGWTQAYAWQKSTCLFCAGTTWLDGFRAATRAIARKRSTPSKPVTPLPGCGGIARTGRR